jgi:CelD/BcsL family acetyltransferase involved in cellulose biosynthesis
MGIPPFSKGLFESIWNNIISRGQGHVIFARVGSEPINAMINLFSGDTLIAAYAAPQNEWRNHYPTDVVFWESIRWGIQAGFRCLDFGADSSEQESLIWFKKKWGAVQSRMHYYYHLYANGSLPNFDGDSSAYQLARRTWSLLPHAISKPLGAIVTRQLS